MANWDKIISAAITAGKAVLSDKDAASFLCGTYADGSPRNVTDAIHGEYLSPKQRKKLNKKKKKKKKKKQTKFKL